MLSRRHLIGLGTAAFAAFSATAFAKAKSSPVHLPANRFVSFPRDEGAAVSAGPLHETIRTIAEGGSPRLLAPGVSDLLPEKYTADVVTALPTLKQEILVSSISDAFKFKLGPKNVTILDHNIGATVRGVALNNNNPRPVVVIPPSFAWRITSAELAQGVPDPKYPGTANYKSVIITMERSYKPGQ